MNKPYKLGEIYPALREASDIEVPIIRHGLRVVTTDIENTPLMQIEYALDESAKEVVSRYVEIS